MSDTLNRPKVGLGVYILNEQNQILMIKRSAAKGGSWCPPGGHLEFGESFFDCAKRETKEETDLEIEDLEMAGVTNDISEIENKHYITIAIKANKFSGEPKNMEPEKHTEIGWFDLNHLPQPMFLAPSNFFASNPLCLCGSGKNFKECHGL